MYNNSKKMVEPTTEIKFDKINWHKPGMVVQNIHSNKWLLLSKEMADNQDLMILLLLGSYIPRFDINYYY